MDVVLVPGWSHVSLSVVLPTSAATRLLGWLGTPCCVFTYKCTVVDNYKYTSMLSVESSTAHLSWLGTPYYVLNYKYTSGKKICRMKRK